MAMTIPNRAGAGQGIASVRRLRTARDRRYDGPMADPSGKHEQLLIYDAECRLCVTAKEGLESRGPRGPVRFVPYQSEEAARRLGDAYRPGRPDAAFLVGADGGIQRGLDAFLPLLPGLPCGRLLTVFARSWPFRWVALRLYRVIARHRYRWFGAVPSPHAPQAK